MPQKVKVFISYACKDKNLRERLDRHLSSLKRQDYIDVWHDRDVGAGRDWKREIDVHLNDAQVILLLVSADFLASDYCYGIEMKRALERHELGEARVIPVILRPVYWEGTPFSHLQALPTAARPVAGPGWRNQDEAFADIVRGLRRAIEELDAQANAKLYGDRDQQIKSNDAGKVLHGASAGVPLEHRRPSLSATTSNRSSVIEQGTLLRQYDVHASWVIGVDWEPNGTRIASAGADGTVRVWDAETGESLHTYRRHTRLLNMTNLQAIIYTVAWAPEGVRIASAGDGTQVQVWNAGTGQTLTRYQGHVGLLSNVFAVAWSPDGKRIVSACSAMGLDKTLHLWDTVTGQLLNRYSVPSGLMPNFSVLSVAWSPDGTRIAATCEGKVIRVWNTETGHIGSTYHFRSDMASHIAWSPDSRYIASALTDHTAQVWDTFTGTSVRIYHGHTEGVRYIAWSPDGTAIATASNDRTVHIWEALTGKRIYIYRGHDNLVTSVAWSPDGMRIVSGSNDKTVHIWQAL